MTVQPAATRHALTADHLPFLARLLEVADQAGVTVTYYCYNADWAVMTDPVLDDEAGTAFLKALGVGDVGNAVQDTSRRLFAGPHLGGGARLYVQPLPTTEEA